MGIMNKSTRASFFTPEHKRHAKEHLISNFTAGPIDFWETSRWCVDFDQRLGKNELANPGNDVFAVTLNGNGSFLKPDDAGKDSLFTKLWCDVRVNWYAFDENTGGVGLLVSVLAAVMAFMVLRGITNMNVWGLIGVAFLTGFSIFFTVAMMYGRAKTNDFKNLRGHRRWDFPVDEDFIVLDNDTAQYTAGLLLKVKERPKMCELVRSKLKLDLDHDSVKEWVVAVNKIIDIDKDFPHDAVPFLNDHVLQALKALRIKAGLIPVPAVGAPSAFDVPALTERVSSPLALLPTAEMRSEMQSATINSEGDLFYALSYIENM